MQADKVRPAVTKKALHQRGEELFYKRFISYCFSTLTDCVCVFVLARSKSRPTG